MAAAPAPALTTGQIMSMTGRNGSGSGFKGGLQVFFGGKEFPSAFSGLGLDVQKAFGFKFEEVSPKFLSGHFGVAPNALPNFGGGLMKGGKEGGMGGPGGDH